jgi:biotin operon repressor
MTQRQFKGIWIPARIWLDKNLNATDKILLADIDSFTGNQKTFYKSNETIAEELFVSIKSVSRSIKKLKDLGYIKIEGNKRVRLVYSCINGQNELNEGQVVFDKGQIDSCKRSKSPSTNTITKSSTNTITNSVELPFESNEFLEVWNDWLKNRKKKYKDGGKRALKRLVKLSDNNEREAIEILDYCLAQNYQGIFKEDKNEKRTNKKFNTEVYSDYLNTL